MTPLGYSALIARFGLAVPPLRQTWQLSPRTGALERVRHADGTEHVTLPRNRYQGDGSVEVMLSFALRREELNLTVLAAAFEHADTIQAVGRWLVAQPTSGYARIAAHLAKWLAGAIFDYALPPGTPRIRVLDVADYIVGPETMDTQLGVANNLLGSRWFCPIIRRTPRLSELLGKDLRTQVSQALERIGPGILSRAVDYLYLSETRSTFSIEDEIPDAERSARFFRLLHSAGEPGPLTEDQLCGWQNSIVVPHKAEMSFRNRQNWLSRSGQLRNIANFIPPAPNDVRPMMDGVAQVARLGASGKIDPALAAACASFGLVFVHPFLDGNGRLHRFLIHHVLRQSGFTPPAIVLPVSARMLNELPTYAELLKSYSTPRTALLDYILDDDSDTILVRSPQPHWLYASFDATPFCEFLLSCIEQTVQKDLASEVAWLGAYDRTVGRVERWLDMRQSRLSLLIRLIVQNGGKLSNTKRKTYDDLSDDELERVEAVVRDEFHEQLGQS